MKTLQSYTAFSRLFPPARTSPWTLCFILAISHGNSTELRIRALRDPVIRTGLESAYMDFVLQDNHTKYHSTSAQTSSTQRVCTAQILSWDALQGLPCTCTCQYKPCVTTGHTISTRFKCTSRGSRVDKHCTHHLIPSTEIRTKTLTSTIP